MNLFLSTRVSPIIQIKQRNKDWKTYAPLPYPDALLFKNESTYEILKEAIRSYSHIKFDIARLYIEIDIDDNNERARILIDLRNLIDENINGREVIIEFNRPSSLADWRALISGIPDEERRSPSIVNMNHDHLHDPKLTLMLGNAVDEVFANGDNDRKILAYTHVPENLSWLNIGKVKNFEKFYNKKFFSEKQDVEWIDCLYIMNLNCLKYIFESIVKTPDYLPRFDWPGVKYQKMHFVKYVYPCGFFYHRDGYGHVTGIRSASWQICRLNFINSDSDDRTYLYAIFDKYAFLLEKEVSACSMILRSKRETFFSLIKIMRVIEFDLNTRMYSAEVAERKDNLINEFTSYNCNELINIYNTALYKFSIKSKLSEFKKYFVKKIFR